MKTNIQLPATLTSMSNTSDGGKRLGFRTQELSIDDKVTLEAAFQQYGWLLFCCNEFQESDIPKEEPEDRAKTPAKRLRNVLYKRWQQTGSGDFEIYYRERMEKYIDHEKNLLEKG